MDGDRVEQRIDVVMDLYHLEIPTFARRASSGDIRFEGTSKRTQDAVQDWNVVAKV